MNTDAVIAKDKRIFAVIIVLILLAGTFVASLVLYEPPPIKGEIMEEGEEVEIPDDYSVTISDSLEHGRKAYAFQRETNHPLGEGEGETYNLYPVLVVANISEIQIISDGDGGRRRIDGGDSNDIDLYLYRPGKEAGGDFEDTDPDDEAATEYISERLSVVRTLELGNWTLRVDCYTGNNVQYDLQIQVVYARGNETESGT